MCASNVTHQAPSSGKDTRGAKGADDDATSKGGRHWRCSRRWRHCLAKGLPHGAGTGRGWTCTEGLSLGSIGLTIQVRPAQGLPYAVHVVTLSVSTPLHSSVLRSGG